MNTLDDIKNSFNEAMYLELNPRVAEVVQKNGFASGWDHYIRHGFRENRPGVPVEVQKQVQKFYAYIWYSPLSRPKTSKIKIETS